MMLVGAAFCFGVAVGLLLAWVIVSRDDPYNWE